MFKLAHNKQLTLGCEASTLVPNKEPPSHKTKKSCRTARILKYSAAMGVGAWMVLA